MKKQYLDAVLVPLGLLLLVFYHLWLLRRFLRKPTKTVIGVNAFNRRIWVNTMMEDPAKTGVLAVQTLRNNIMASTLLASMSIMLSSLIAVLMTRGWGSPTSTLGVNKEDGLVYGNRSEQLLSLKFFCILACFLLAFLFNVQSIRYYSHAGVLINVPMNRSPAPHAVTAGYVTRALDRGSFFWTMGLRAFYFSFPLFLWLFGPIPMLACCFLMVLFLYFFDASSEWKPQDAGRSPQGGSVSD